MNVTPVPPEKPLLVEHESALGVVQQSEILLVSTILKKYEKFVNGKDDIPYMKWKIKVMFQSTNQLAKLTYD